MPRKIMLFFALLFFACLRAGAQDRSTPEATVRSFIAAFGRGDIKEAIACVKGAQTGSAALQTLAQQIKKEPVLFTLSDAKTTLNGTTASLAGQVSMKPETSEKAEKAQTSAIQVALASVGGSWQIVPNAAKAQQSANPDIVNALAYMLTDTKVFTRARDSARGAACLSNIKQMCLGALLLAQDYDEAFKLKADTFKKSLMPYIKNASVFKCPADASGAISYSFNSRLVGVNQTKIQFPAETVLIYEGKNGVLNFRHDGKAAIGFADGHAKLVNAEGAKKLRWKP